MRATKDLPILHTVVLATIGSVLAIPGVFQAELLGGILGPWIWAPIIEEIFKPAGVYLLLLQWPRALKNQIYTALLTALAGISFGLVESTIYVTVYIPDPTTQEVVLRFTLPVFMHALASFIFGLGINKRLMVPLTGGGSIHVSNWGFFVAAIAIHSIYNITVTIIEVIGAV